MGEGLVEDRRRRRRSEVHNLKKSKKGRIIIYSEKRGRIEKKSFH